MTFIDGVCAIVNLVSLVGEFTLARDIENSNTGGISVAGRISTSTSYESVGLNTRS